MHKNTTTQKQWKNRRNREPLNIVSGYMFGGKGHLWYVVSDIELIFMWILHMDVYRA